MSGTNYLLCLLLCVFKVNSMAIRGPPLTKYDPCGLGAIHFDKFAEKFWQATVFLNKYPTIKNEIIMDLEFEKNVTIYGYQIRKPITWHYFQFRVNGSIPTRYMFFVQLEDNDDSNVPRVKKFSLNNNLLCDEIIKSSQTIESLNVTQDVNHYAHVCGRRAIDHAELNSIRTESKAGDWPWHVAILFKVRNTNGTRYACGGNIISRTTIVTAGHCVIELDKTLEANRLIILAGVDNHKDVTQIGRQELMAEEVILHPNYNYKEATADLAIIKVKKIVFTEYVQPICLWGPVYDKTMLYGHQATIVGFGTKEDGQLSDVLRSSNTVVQNDSTCLDYDRPLYSSLLNEFTFCAGYGPQFDINPRNGDSGGGLVIPTIQPDHKISWFLRGVLSKCGISQGDTQCNPRFYTVYTDVGPHYGWIYHHSGLQFSSNILKKNVNIE